MIWTDLRGHAASVEMFRRAVQRGRMAHAYLLVGPSGIGKRLVATRIAQALFCERHPDAELDACGVCGPCKQVQAGTHPDLLMLGLPEGKKELPMAALVGTEERRGREGLLYELSLRPMSAARRIAIIDDADRLSEESANALLKTLEEPPPGSVLFLLTPSSDLLLPTIRSRCQPLVFSPLAVEDVAALLLAHECTTDRQAAEEAARLSGGSLDTARQLLAPELRQLRELLHAVLSNPRFSPVETARQVLSALEELGGGTAGQREYAAWLLRFAVDFFRQVFAPTENVSAPIAQFRRAFPLDDPRTADQATLALERTLRAEEELQQLLPPPLCLESYFHDLGRIFRGA
jgi:DNA polymerase-3 subunit delta'